MNKDLLFYYLIRILTFPFAYMSYRTLHICGNILGLSCFYLMKKFRKRVLSNLALAKNLHLTKKELFSTAKKSFQNLAIVMLEYAKLDKEKDLKKVITCENANNMIDLYKNGQGIIILCGHQANWETLFLYGNIIMNGVAIAQPIKNKILYKWILSIREKTGGKVVNLKNALYEGIKCLKKGKCLGIVGDQSVPSSNYSYPMFGRPMWLSTATALIAYKTKSPIVVATTKRTENGYKITYSDPIWPQPQANIESEEKRLMDESLKILETSIMKTPHEWLWQHNCYKQQTLKNIKRKFRHDAICLILPQEKEEFEMINQHLPTLKTIYLREFIFVILPTEYQEKLTIAVDEIMPYQRKEECLINDYRFKLVFDFSNHKKTKPFYKRLNVYDVLTIEDLKKMAYPNITAANSLSDIFQSAICRQPLKTNA